LANTLTLAIISTRINQPEINSGLDLQIGCQMGLLKKKYTSFLLLCCFYCALHATTIYSYAQESKQLIYLQQGELPIIISAPHGGELDIPDAKPRSGEGLEKKPGGFVTARDTGTSEIARLLADSVQKTFGRPPYVVVNLAHRKYMDPNRPAAEAYEEPAARKVYDEYHGFLDKACREVREKFHTGILVDLHGQGSRRNTVFRGTQNGLTVALLKQRFGDRAHTGDQSFFGLLRARGFTVFPDPLDGKEQAGFTGGFIVRNYGSHDKYGIDAIQLEFGGLYRTISNRHTTAEVVKSALAAYATEFLEVKPLQNELIKFAPSQESLEKESPDKRNNDQRNTDKTSTEKNNTGNESTKKQTVVNYSQELLDDPQKIDIAVYVGAGTSNSRDKVVSSLEAYDNVRVHQLTSDDVLNGKLQGMEIVLQPGGSGGAQAKGLGPEGREVIKSFVSQGGGYIGICAGAYLATCDYDWSLHILDAKVIDRAHWARGFGDVQIEFSSQGQDFFQQKSALATTYYHQGPLLAPADNPSIPDFESLATYKSEIAKNDAPVNVLDDAAKAQGKVVGSFKIDLTNPPPQGWRYWTTPYSPKFANPRIVDPATGLKVPTSALGSKTGLHELQHFLDATQHPQLYYFARASNAPGAGLAHFVFETRGYLQSHGLQALFNPSLAMASVRHAGRAHLVYRDLAGLAGLGGLGGFVYWFTSNESGQQ